MKASVGSFIRGLEDGLVTMNAGEKARLYVPWFFGYGISGHKGNIHRVAEARGGCG